jgi:hypothetical protein
VEKSGVFMCYEVFRILTVRTYSKVQIGKMSIIMKNFGVRNSSSLCHTRISYWSRKLNYQRGRKIQCSKFPTIVFEIRKSTFPLKINKTH